MEAVVKLILIGTAIMALSAVLAFVLKAYDAVTELGLFIVLGVLVVGLIVQSVGLFTIRPPKFPWQNRR